MFLQALCVCGCQLTPGGWTWESAETEFPLVPGSSNVYQVSINLNGESFKNIF
jgi:hypothetical protein